MDCNKPLMTIFALKSRRAILSFIVVCLILRCVMKTYNERRNVHSTYEYMLPLIFDEGCLLFPTNHCRAMMGDNLSSFIKYTSLW